jgi:hypothetical protein
MNNQNPDWNKLSSITIMEHSQFTAEQYDYYLNQMWIKIVKDPDRHNNEIYSIWTSMCEYDRQRKIHFLQYVLETRLKSDPRPIDWKDVLRYFKSVTIAEEFCAHSIKQIE